MILQADPGRSFKALEKEIRSAAHKTLLLQLKPEHICGKLVTEA